MTTSNRLEQRFKKLKELGRAGLVTFTTAGDPNIETATYILKKLPAAGADIIELGMPFSDPMADGPAIQLANLRALAAGATLEKTLQMVANFREIDNETPIILMGYYNPIHYYGTLAFLEKAMAVGVDGLIIVDLPPEEDNELCHPSLTAGMDWIRLITPTTDDNRLPVVLNNSSGFVYYVSIAGITGTQSAKQSNIETAVKRIKKHTNLPVAVGFGIKSPQQVAEVAEVADAVVVGSALVNKIAEGNSNNLSDEETAQNLLKFVKDLASGLKT